MKIVLEIRFGLPQAVYADGHADVLVIDHDTGTNYDLHDLEKASLDGVHLLHDGQVAFLDHFKAKDDPIETQRFFADYESIYGALV